MKRRTISIGLVIVLLLISDGLGITGIDAVMNRLREGSGGKTPTVKEFDPQWVRSLFQRGQLTVYTSENSSNFEYIGMPIGYLLTLL